MLFEKKMNYREFKKAVEAKIGDCFVREVRPEEIRVFSVEEDDMILDKFQLAGDGVPLDVAPVIDLHEWYDQYFNQYEGDFINAIYYMARRYEKEFNSAVQRLQKPVRKIQTSLPKWVSSVDNLITALEIYRNEEAKAIARIETLLAEKGIHISKEDMKKAETEDIREQIRREEQQKEEHENEQRAAEKRGAR